MNKFIQWVGLILIAGLVVTGCNADTDTEISGEILFTRIGGELGSGILQVDAVTGEETALTPPYSFEDDIDGEQLFLALSWSPDGSQVLATNMLRDLYLINPDDGTTTKLTDSPGQNNVEALWSPDGSQIIFTALRRFDESDDQEGAIYRIDLNNGTEEPLTISGSEIYSLTLSPDGSQIAYLRDDVIYSVPIDGNESVEISSDYQYPSNITWSPDGSQIAVLTYTGVSEHDLYVMDADGSNSRLLVSDSGEIREVQWSPDSTQLLFIANVEYGYAATLGLVTVETGEVATYSNNEGVFESIIGITSLAWSPDGTYIAFSSLHTDDYCMCIYVVDSEFSEIQRITNVTAQDFVSGWRPQEQE